MKKLQDTKDTFTMHLLDHEMCIFAQNKPYEDCDLLIENIMNYNFTKDLVVFRSKCENIKVSIEIVTSHEDGVLLYNGIAVTKFIYVNSFSTNRFSVNGRTNLKETMHTAALDYLKYHNIINSENEVIDNTYSRRTLPKRSIVQG